jgi:hypothetical protein
LKRSVNWNCLAERGIETHAERTAKQVASAVAENRLAGVAGRNAVLPGVRNCGAKAAAFRTGFPAFTPVVPCN